jgi:hypothetical protein
MLLKILTSIAGYESEMFTTKNLNPGVTDFGNSRLGNSQIIPNVPTYYLDSISVAEYIYIPMLAVGYLLLSLYNLDRYKIASIDFV